MTREEALKRIEESEEQTVGALLRLYSFQEPDEQASGMTKKLNDAGFNAVDAPILSDMAEFYHKRGYLTEKQIAFVRKVIRKYVGQLLAYGWEPAPILRKNGETSIPQATKMEAELEGDRIVARFNFPHGDPRFQAALALVKGIPGRRWKKEDRSWRIPPSLDAYETLVKGGFKIGPKLEAWYKELTAPAKDGGKAPLPALRKPLYPFQEEGVQFVERRRGRALLAHSMGLGKTVMAITYIAAHPESLPAVVVCPAAVKLNWQKEFRMWLKDPLRVQVISGRKNGGLPPADVYVINYDILIDRLEELKALHPGIVVYDEIHYTKNSKALRTKAAKRLAKAAKKVIGLSGTPIVNRPIEFYNAIQMIQPGLSPSFWSFAKRYTNARHNGFGWEFKGARNTKELHEKLTKTIMIRRCKEDVLEDLPPKRRIVVPMEITNREEYRRAAEDILNWIFKNEGRPKAERASKAEVLVRFEKLKQLAVQGKMDSCVAWIRDFLDSGEKLVVFCTHTETVDELMREFKGTAVKLDGSTPAKERQVVVDRFQTDDRIRLFVGNLQAAGVGITLTAASTTCFVELGWTPGDHEQAEDRVHRIGQKAESVTAYYLIAEGTIEEEIAALLDEKRAVLSKVLDGKDVEADDLLTELIVRLQGKEEDDEGRKNRVRV